MNEIIFAVADAPEGGFTARALGASIYTEADSLPELRECVRDAVRCHFEEGESPSTIRLHYVGDGHIPLDPVVAIPASEAWLWERPALRASLERALTQAGEGEFQNLGSFAQFVDDDE